MAVSDGSGEVLYRFVYDTYGELSDIKTDDGISLKNSEIVSEKTKDHTVEELAHAAGFIYLYNGQYGVATDQNGLYYMRARYYDQDIKRFINRDIVSGDIGNSKSLNRYAYVQGNPVSLTDPFGLCPDSNSSVRLVRTFLCDTDWSTVGHTALDIVGIFWDGADVINAFWYAAEGNTEMAIASAVYALPGIGMASGRLMMCSDKLYKAGKTVYRASKLTQGCYGVIGGLTMAGAGIGNIYNSLKNGEKISFKDIALAVGGTAIAIFSGKTLVSDMRQVLGISNKVDRTIKVGNADISHEPVPSEKKILEAAESGNTNRINKTPITNSKGVAYPDVQDIRTGQSMIFPSNVNGRVPKENRVGWYRNQREANLYRTNDTDILCRKDYIDEWYKRGYETPEGGWDLYEIHHIKPREFGGSADFENMTPLLKDVHRKVVTPWWNSYK